MCLKGHIFLTVDIDGNDIKDISLSLHAAMNNFIGRDELVLIRRTATNLRDEINRMVNESTNAETIPIFSGSKAEGLRFKSSDEDWMFEYRSLKVIPSDSYTALYNNNPDTLMLFTMDNEMSKPGFTLLRVVEYYRNGNKYLLCRGHECSPIVPMLNGRFISSKIWRESDIGRHTSHSVFIHGPCSSCKSGENEFDWAHCLRGDFWPANAHSTIQRLCLSSWLSRGIISSIVNDGIMFVPIGMKQSFFEDTEWRMSFSLAEKRLIHSMNHTQFLCYGLLKLFLKEAIDVNPEVNGLLCSYFMKTALFWEITTSSNNWNSSTLLQCFWKCFCRLLQWVNSSYCPNFFIPENNMFEGKIEGENRSKLLQHLTTLYHEGYRCLQRCFSLTEYKISEVIHGQTTVVGKGMCKTCIAQTVIIEESGSSPLHTPCFSVDREAVCLLLDHCMPAANNSLARLFVVRWLCDSLTRLCIPRSNQTLLCEEENKLHYKYYVQKKRVLKKCRRDSTSHYLYQATECYNYGIYTKTLILVQRAKTAIFSHNSICATSEPALHTQYENAGVEDIPIDTVLKKCFVSPLSTMHIPELMIENHFSRGWNYEAPAVVYAMFLQYLCYEKLGLRLKRDGTINDLSFIVRGENDSCNITRHYLDISWEMLGICQYMNGDNPAAFRSYVMSLYYSYRFLQPATCMRIGIILSKSI